MGSPGTGHRPYLLIEGEPGPDGFVDGDNVAVWVISEDGKRRLPNVKKIVWEVTAGGKAQALIWTSDVAIRLHDGLSEAEEAQMRSILSSEQLKRMGMDPGEDADACPKCGMSGEAFVAGSIMGKSCTKSSCPMRFKK